MMENKLLIKFLEIQYMLIAWINHIASENVEIKYPPQVFQPCL